MASDIVARYTLKLRDLASKGLLRAASAAKALASISLLGAAGIGALGLGVAALSRGAFKLGDSYANMVDELSESGAKFNVTATYLKDLRFALGQAGVEASDVDAGLGKFNVQLGQMSLGVGSFAKKLQQTAPALAAQLKGVTDGTKANQIAIGYLSTINDAQQRAAISAQLYGKSAGPAFAAAAADLTELNAAFARSRQMTGVIGPNQIAMAGAYEKSMGQLKGSYKALGMVIGAEVLPIIIKFTDKLTGFIQQNGGKIKLGISDAFAKIGTAIEGIDWETFGDGVVKIIAFLPSLVNGFGWVIDNIKILVGAFVGIKVVGFASSLGILMPILKGVGVGLSIFRGALGYIGPVAMRIGSLLLNGLGKMALRAGTMFLRFLGPIGLVVTAGILLYQNWDTVKVYLFAAWEGIKRAFSLGLQYVEYKWEQVKQAFSDALNYFASLKDRFFEWGGKLISGLVDGIWNSIAKVGEAISGVARSAGNAISEALGYTTAIPANAGQMIAKDLNGQLRRVQPQINTAFNNSQKAGTASANRARAQIGVNLDVRGFPNGVVMQARQSSPQAMARGIVRGGAF